MGRVNQAMRRARQSGLVTEFEPIAVSAYDASVLSAEPFPAEGVQEPAAPAAIQEPAVPDAPKTAAVSRQDDREIQDIFFNTYSEKVWDGPKEEEVRLLRLLAKVERHSR
jgi:hypothetical protein